MSEGERGEVRKEGVREGERGEGGKERERGRGRVQKHKCIHTHNSAKTNLYTIGKRVHFAVIHVVYYGVHWVYTPVFILCKRTLYTP